MLVYTERFLFIFDIRNGVRQGGVFSPFLFAVCIDDLTSSLRMINVGCYIVVNTK